MAEANAATDDLVSRALEDQEEAKSRRQETRDEMDLQRDELRHKNRQSHRPDAIGQDERAARKLEMQQRIEEAEMERTQQEEIDHQNQIYRKTKENDAQKLKDKRAKELQDLNPTEKRGWFGGAAKKKDDPEKDEAAGGKPGLLSRGMGIFKRGKPAEPGNKYKIETQKDDAVDSDPPQNNANPTPQPPPKVPAKSSKPSPKVPGKHDVVEIPLYNKAQNKTRVRNIYRYIYIYICIYR